MVRAGPGSGKTWVIVERAVRLVEEGIARPEELLVLTFSRKAASDLKERLAARLRRSHAGFPVTTFHAFCLSILAREAGDPPQLAGSAERRNLVRQALAAADNLGYPASASLTEEALAFCQLCDDYLEVPEHPLAPVRESYVEALAKRGLFDYGGLQREAITALAADPELRRAYAERFRYVLVDEYQDTDVAQDMLLELLGGGHRNVFCVADEDQSIYGFRGAEIENALGFEKRWDGVEYHLPTNYRSAPAVVELATSVIRRNVVTHREKELQASEKRPAELRRRAFRHAAEEADWIAREVARLRLNGVPLGEIAILARSLREMGPRLAYALRRHGIAFHAPLEAPLHPTVDALLGLIELARPGPWEHAQEEQALRVLSSPLFRHDALGLRRFRREPCTLREALEERDEFDSFFTGLAALGQQGTIGSAVYELWGQLEYFRALQERCRRPDAAREDVDELAAVTALSDAANAYEGASDKFSQSFRLGEFAREEWLPIDVLPPDAVALLTVHQAKGLEWQAVFVCDLVEGRFPALARSEYALFARDDFSRRPLPPAERARRALEEERRLFYVALSRAKTELTLTATEEAHEGAGRAISRFYLEAEDFLAQAVDRDGPVSADEALAALRRAGGGEPGWRDREKTENATPMLPPGSLYLSASRLAPYDDCPLQFYYSSLLDLIRVRTPEMTLGGVFHSILEDFHHPERAEPQTLERLHELAAEHWTDEGMGPPPLAAEKRRLLTRMLENYFRWEVQRGFDGEVLKVEARFRFPLDDTPISGFIDRIDRRHEGDLRLVDYKTSKHPISNEEAARDLQLALYALACEEVEELRDLGKVAELAYLYPQQATTRGIGRRTQPVTTGLSEHTRDRLRGLISEITAEHFEPSPEADCRFCEFKPLCPRWYGSQAPL